MARARNIKPGFFMNEVLGEQDPATRLLFIGLWTLADREGRLEDRPRRIKSALFPYDSFDIDPMLDRLRVDGFIVQYEVDGDRYIQLVNFVKHQDPHYKEKASEIPAAPGTEDLIKAVGLTRSVKASILERDGHTCLACGAVDHLCVDHKIPVSRGGSSDPTNLQTLCFSCNAKKGNKLDGEAKGFRKGIHSDTSLLVRPNVGVNLIQRNDASPSDSLIPDSGFSDSLIPDKDSGAEAPISTLSKRKTRIPPDFGVSERVRKWADAKGYGMLEQHLEALKRKCAANDYKKLSWDDFFMEAIREDWAKLRARALNGSAPPPDIQCENPAIAATAAAMDKRDANRAPPSDEVRRRMAEITGKLTVQPRPKVPA